MPSLRTRKGTGTWMMYSCLHVANTCASGLRCGEEKISAQWIAGIIISDEDSLDSQMSIQAKLTLPMAMPCRNAPKLNVDVAGIGGAVGRGIAAGTPSDGSGGGGSDWEGGMRNPRNSILDEVKAFGP